MPGTPSEAPSCRSSLSSTHRGVTRLLGARFRFFHTGNAMQIHLTVPLIVRTTSRKKLELMPVVMGDKLPSQSGAVFAQFIKPLGDRLSLDKTEVEKVQAYMLKYGTEALSEDGSVAYTIHGDGLVECLPDAVAAGTGPEDV